MADLIKGDTVTIGVTFPEEYDPERIINITAALQGREVASLEDETVVATDDPRVFLVKLTSNVTRNFSGGIPLTIALTDTQLRVKHTKPYNLYFFDSPFALQDAGTKDVIDLSVTLNVSEAGLINNVNLASIYRGYSAYEIAVYKYGYNGTEAQWNTAVNAARVAAENAATDTAADRAAVLELKNEVIQERSLVGQYKVAAENAATDTANDKVAVVALKNEVIQERSLVGQYKVATENAAAAAAADRILTGQYKDATITNATQAASSAASAAAIVTGQSTGQSDVLPTVNWQFAKSKVLPRAITFVRNSIATYFDAQGILRTARPNEPCFDHDPVTGESLGLASWEARTNMSWGIIPGSANVTLTYNAGIAPDGTNTAILAQNTPGTTSFTWTQCAPLTDGIYTRSIYVKAAGSNAVLFFEGIGDTIPGGNTVNFNINTLTWGAGGGINSLIDKGFQQLKGGWVRVWIVVEKSPTKNAGGNTHYVGSGSLNHSFYMWGPQVELGSFPTPYIPTSTGVVTRQEDAITYTGTSEGTVNLEARTIYPSLTYAGASRPIEFFGGGGYIISTDATSSYLYVLGGTMIANNNTGYLQYTKWAISGNGTTVRVAKNGSAIASASCTTAKGTVKIAGRLNGHIRYLQYYPVALADTQLQLITTAGSNLIGDKASQLPTAGKLGGMAYLSYAEIAALRQRVELNFQGAGAQVAYTIRRPYPFSLAIVNNSGSTTATLPTAPSDGIYLADTNYTLLHNAPVGTILTVELIPSIVQ